MATPAAGSNGRAAIGHDNAVLIGACSGSARAGHRDITVTPKHLAAAADADAVPPRRTGTAATDQGDRAAARGLDRAAGQFDPEKIAGFRPCGIC